MAVLFTVSVSAKEIVDSGECGAQGDNVTWVLYDDGELVLTGYGEMEDWYYSGPWYDVKTVIVNEGITTIGNYAFCYNVNLESITLPNSIITIGYCSFAQCHNLYSINVPNGVQKIYDEAFESCLSLVSVNLPKSLTELGNNCFSRCGNLTEISVDDDNEFFSDDEFGVLFNKDKTKIIHYPMSNPLKSYTIPDSVVEIETVFRDCDILEYITIGKGISEIKPYAFEHCGNLKSVTIPLNVTEIGAGAFRQCYALTNIVIPNSITQISNYMFESCSKITNIDIPESVEVIGERAFSGCSSLKNITIPKNIKVIGDQAFFCCNKLEKTVIQNEDVKIGLWAFYTLQNEVTSNTIYGYKNSTAETYALENNIPFIVIDEPVEPSTPDTPSEPNDDCSCNCHAGGIKSFFFKILNFFEKLFGKNKVCACGVKH